MDLSSLPHRCLAEVEERIHALKHPQEQMVKDHEDHALFKQEQDEQLLLWIQR